LVTVAFSFLVRLWTYQHLLIASPLSPDLAPEDFFPFPKVKVALKGECFSNIRDICSVTELLKGPFSMQDFHHGFEELYK
jgi:hypothetical protein